MGYTNTTNGRNKVRTTRKVPNSDYVIFQGPFVAATHDADNDVIAAIQAQMVEAGVRVVSDDHLRSAVAGFATRSHARLGNLHVVYDTDTETAVLKRSVEVSHKRTSVYHVATFCLNNKTANFYDAVREMMRLAADSYTVPKAGR